MIRIALLAVAFIVSVASADGIKDEYHEELFIKPFNGYVYTYFQFSTIWKVELGNDTCEYLFVFIDFYLIEANLPAAHTRLC